MSLTGSVHFYLHAEANVADTIPISWFPSHTQRQCLQERAFHRGPKCHGTRSTLHLIHLWNTLV